MSKNKKINIENIEFLISKINSEGFDYCLIDYSNWEEIDDKKFHVLRNKYIESRKKLREYIEIICDEKFIDE